MNEEPHSPDDNPQLDDKYEMLEDGRVVKPGQEADNEMSELMQSHLSIDPGINNQSFQSGKLLLQSLQLLLAAQSIGQP